MFVSYKRLFYAIIILSRGNYMRKKLEDIIKELKKNDHSRFDSFYELTSRHVFYIALAIVRDESLAEDVMQDSYLKILKSAAAYKPGTNPLAWILTITRNTAINVYNRRKREIVIDPKAKEFAGLTEENRDTPLIDLMNRVLKPKERELVVLHVINGLTHREIAKVLKRPLGTVLWQYNRTIKKLREKAGEEYE